MVSSLAYDISKTGVEPFKDSHEVHKWLFDMAYGTTYIQDNIRLCEKHNLNLSADYVSQQAEARENLTLSEEFNDSIRTTDFPMGKATELVDILPDAATESTITAANGLIDDVDVGEFI